MGVLRQFLLSDNPVLCHPEFNTTAELMEANATKIHGDFSICPLVEVPSTTTDSVISTPVNSTPSPVDNVNAVNFLPILRINQPDALPLIYNPRLHDSGVENGSKISTSSNSTKNETVPFTENSPAAVKNNEWNKTAPEGNLLHSGIMHPPVIFKDEGRNITLVIPVENGIVKKDHVIDQYMQKSGKQDIHDQSSVSSSISNIEIVEIKQLPNESSLKGQKNEKPTDAE